MTIHSRNTHDVTLQADPYPPPATPGYAQPDTSLTAPMEHPI